MSIRGRGGFRSTRALVSAAVVLFVAVMLAVPASSQTGPLDEQIRAQLAGIPGALPGLDSQLSEVARAASHSGPAAGLSAARESGVPTRAGTVRVIVEAREGQADAAAAAVETVGGVVESRYELLVQARVAPTLLQMLAADPAVRWLRAPDRLEPMAVSGEGVSAVSRERMAFGRTERCGGEGGDHRPRLRRLHGPTSVRGICRPVSRRRTSARVGSRPVPITVLGWRRSCMRWHPTHNWC